jgi:transposase
MEKIDARKLSSSALKEMRRLAMRMREELQLTWKEIAKVVGVNTGTVLAWSQRYAAQGEAGLESKKPGRTYLSGRTLTLAQEWLVRTILTSESPQTRGLAFALWSRRAVMQLIDKLFAIQMPIRTVGEYLLRWGYTPQRPKQRALEQNPLDVERWMKEIYPVIARHAKEQGAIIYWGDETAVSQDGHWVRGYAPAGQTPVLATPSKRHGLTMVSAVSNQGLVRFEFIQGAMNTPRVIDFMQRLIQDSTGKVMLVLDNLRAHHANEVTQWLKQNQDRIEVFYLPAYAPQSNPDEYLNEDFKKYLRSAERSSSKEDLLKKAENFMSFLQNTPERVKAYFANSEVKYAA